LCRSSEQLTEVAHAVERFPDDTEPRGFAVSGRAGTSDANLMIVDDVRLELRVLTSETCGGHGETLNSGVTVSATQSPPGMVWIPGGSFRMGSDDHYSEERPVHRVKLAASGSTQEPSPTRSLRGSSRRRVT
jgi:formylglycine-generating enzyme required for sulfatase activity